VCVWVGEGVEGREVWVWEVCVWEGVEGFRGFGEPASVCAGDRLLSSTNVIRPTPGPSESAPTSVCDLGVSERCMYHIYRLVYFVSIVCYYCDT
jgi:hypothetical protein